MHALSISTCALRFITILAKPLGPLSEDLQGPFDPVSLDPSSYNSGSSDLFDQDSLFLDSIGGTHSPIFPEFFDDPETIRKIYNIDQNTKRSPRSK